MEAREKSDHDLLGKESHGTGVGAGEGMAHAVNHDREDAYWRGAHMLEPYYNPEHSYEDYAPAYRMGWESRAI